MYLCYIDESGTPDIPGNTSHFVLAGLSMPIWHWRDADRAIEAILTKYQLQEAELHTAWMMRRYIEQSKIPGFDNLGYSDRRSAVNRWRNSELLRLQKINNRKRYKQEKKNYKHTDPYIHLTYDERMGVLREVADTVSGWGFARLFAEAIDKIHFDPTKSGKTVEEQAFEQVVSRFQRYLVITGSNPEKRNYGLVVHDNNESVAKKHTDLMRRFHRMGTPWTNIDRIIETPLFVDSKLTRMVQIADLCSVSIRRYLENGDTELFERIFDRGDRVGETVVGVRHYTTPNVYNCIICKAHASSAPN